MSRSTFHKGLVKAIPLLYLLDQVSKSSKDKQEPQELSI